MKPCSHMYVAVQLFNKMKAKILQGVGSFHRPERRLKINSEGGPHEKTIGFMSSFLFLSTLGHVLDCYGVPRPFLKLNTDANSLCVLF